jgi:adenylate cyclase
MSHLRKRYDIVAVLLFFLLASFLEYQEPFSLLEDETLSYRQLMRTYYGDPELSGPSEDVVIVYTDEDFYAEYEKFPLMRVDLAQIVDRLKQVMGAKVIGIDMLLDFNSAYGEDPTLELAFEEAGNVLLVSQADIAGDEFIKLNRAIPRFASRTVNGYSNIHSTSAISESIVRLTVYPEITAEQDGWPFAVQAVAMFLGETPVMQEGVLTIGDQVNVPLDQFNDMYIDYPLLPGDGAVTQRLHDVIGISASDILFEDEEALEDLSFLVEGKIVLIGEVAEVSHDEFETPLGNVFGVEIIANTIATILKNASLQPASFVAESLVGLVLMLSLMGTTLLHNPAPRTLVSFLLMVAHIVAVSLTYIYLGIVFSMSYILIAGFLSFLMISARFYLNELGQKALIRDAFGQYLSPKVVSDLVKDPEKLTLGGEEREMTAYFSDIEGFSSFSERLSPTDLVYLLNEYLTDMCNILIGYEGTVDKFEGDAIISFWGAPSYQEDHAKLACYASIEMNQALVPFREKMLQEHRPEIRVRMGLNTGSMLVGNMGSAQRMNYTMMGNAVNLAARLEGANKVYGSDIMISQFTYEFVRDLVDVRELDTIRVVGINEPVTVYQLLDRKNRVAGKQADLVESFQRGLASYKQRDFVAAMAQFKKGLSIVKDDGPSLTYHQRCQEYQTNPPDETWDGVFTLAAKG